MSLATFFFRLDSGVSSMDVVLGAVVVIVVVVFILWNRFLRDFISLATFSFRLDSGVGDVLFAVVICIFSGCV